MLVALFLGLLLLRSDICKPHKAYVTVVVTAVARSEQNMVGDKK